MKGAKPVQHKLKIPGRTIIYWLVREEGRVSVGVKYTKEGLLVSAPKGASLQQIKRVLLRNIDQIVEILNKVVPPKKRFADNETFPYLGKGLRLSIKRKPKARHIKVFKTPRMIVVEGPPDMRSDQIRSVLIKWYREEARVFLFGKVQAWARRMRVKPKRVFIKDQKSGWGSCSGRGNINLNFRVIMAPEPMVDYVVVHELAHLRHRNHSKDFWNFVADFIPDHKERRRWFRENGRALRW
ncbi:MAG: SprT family zinc-dependent metalloprotease [candidate division WOR-3 bacterium]